MKNDETLQSKCVQSVLETTLDNSLLNRMETNKLKNCLWVIYKEGMYDKHILVLPIKIGTNDFFLKEMLTTTSPPPPKYSDRKSTVWSTSTNDTFFFVLNERETNTIQSEKRTDLSNAGTHVCISICWKRATNIHVNLWIVHAQVRSFTRTKFVNLPICVCRHLFCRVNLWCDRL